MIKKKNLRAAWCWCLFARNGGEQAAYQRKRWAKQSKMKSGSSAAPCKRVILQDLSGKLLWTMTVDRMLIPSPALPPIGIFQMAFFCACSSTEKTFLLSPWSCLLAFSRLLPIHANVGQDLSCLPEVWSQCKLLSLLHWGKVLLSTCQI